MAIPNQTPYNVFTANGISTVFPYEFYLLSAIDLTVSINGTVQTTGYTVLGVGNIDGGEVVFLTPPTNGSVILLQRLVPTYRLTEYQDNGDLLADTVNKDFDRLWMAIQQAFLYLGLTLNRPLLGGPFNATGYRIENLADPINAQDAATKNYVDATANDRFIRTLRVPESTVATLPPVSVRGNKLLAFNSAGDPISVLPESGSASDVMIEFAKPTGAGAIGVSTNANGVNTVQGFIDNAQWQFAKSVLKSGGRNDKATDNTTLIQAMINGMDSGYIVIEYGCRWDSRIISKKDDVLIIDQSGYNPASNQWGAQINYLVRTSAPETKNANEFVLHANHHPAFVINNDGTGVAYRASWVLRLDDVSIWRNGMGISDADTHYVLASKGANDAQGRPTYPGRLYISSTSDSFAFNAPLLDDTTYHFGNRTWTDNLIIRFSARTDKGTYIRFYTGTVTQVLSHALLFNPDGSITFNQNGTNTIFFGVNGEIYGNNTSVLPRPSSININHLNQGRFITNEGASGAVAYTLPAAAVGLNFDFCVISPYNITITGGVIRGSATNRVDCAIPGSAIKIACLTNGVWDVIYKNNWILG